MCDLKKISIQFYDFTIWQNEQKFDTLMSDSGLYRSHFLTIVDINFF